jgi:hypothetical protein
MLPSFPANDAMDNSAINAISPRQFSWRHAACVHRPDVSHLGLGQFGSPVIFAFSPGFGMRIRAVPVSASQLLGMHSGTVPISAGQSLGMQPGTVPITPSQLLRVQPGTVPISASQLLGMRSGTVSVSARRPLRVQSEAVPVSASQSLRVQPGTASVTGRGPSFAVSVRHVVGMSPEPEMGRVHTGGVIPARAVVQYAQPIGDGTGCQGPGEAVGENGLSLVAQSSVTRAVKSSGPKPTAIRTALIYFGPEIFNRVRTLHDATPHSPREECGRLIRESAFRVRTLAAIRNYT